MRVVVVGGGAIGSAVACWLTADPAFAGEVVVVERDPTYARASSALSAGSIRQQFSTSVNVEIGRFGIGFLRAIAELIRHGGYRTLDLAPLGWKRLLDNRPLVERNVI